MKKTLPILMLITILAIAGFQAYWLRDNYNKEKKNLQLRTDVAFAETIRNLQGKKLRLDRFFDDSLSNFNVEVNRGNFYPPGHFSPGEFAGIINDVSVRITDSLSGHRIVTGHPVHEWVENGTADIKDLPDSASVLKGDKRKILITYSNKDTAVLADSAGVRIRRRSPSGDIIRFLYSVDSLQDSLKVSEIDSAYRLSLQKQDIRIPFSVHRYDSLQVNQLSAAGQRPLNKITLGIRHPVTYELKLGNAFAYLLKKIASPILFSLFLVGVTILSFLLLYRNLLRQQRLTDIKNEFIGNITHELKTPIATVSVAIEALRNFNAINDPQRTREYLDISQNELHRLGLLVDKVLKLAMFEKQEIELKYEEIALKDIVDEVVSSMKLQLGKHHASVSVHHEGNTSLQGDRLHLLSVVFNLLDNAIKYSNGHTAIQISVKDKENEVELAVADNGIGIPQEYKDKVFEKFFRVPAGDTHNTKGYGLGLSYVLHVIQKHKGKIEVESQPGLGTKFIISLPRNILTQRT